MINMKTKCCNQYMAAIHPFYKRNVFLTSPDGPRITLSKSEKVEPQLMAIYMSDFPPEKYKLLPKDKPHVDFKNPEHLKKYGDALQKMASAMGKEPEKGAAGAVTFQDLMSNEWKKKWNEIEQKYAPK